MKAIGNASDELRLNDRSTYLAVEPHIWHGLTRSEKNEYLGQLLNLSFDDVEKKTPLPLK